ncbi:MAG: PD40 domain-containing protein [Candidatus Cloacimonetes bacterium]|nr:PD40 domain-containing protein [Candidatus Cloacimonadota bacterium]
MRFACALLALLLPLLASAFGQNKVQYDHKVWRFIESQWFDVYYYQGGYDQAVFTAQVADSAYQQLSRDFDWELPDNERIVIITYQSHNDFANTNVSSGLVEESVGGFTEFFKNRVVIPFQGSWEDYRHVIHHELTHAISLSMIYGDSILRGAIRFPLPLWFAEGLSEWTSRGGWDREANMFMADASISGYLGDIPQLYGFLSYKGGQSVFNYIEYEFGKPKVAEIMHRVKSMHNVERAFESSLGYGVEELSVKWKAYLNRIYWPTIKDRQIAWDLADRITDHRELRNFVNNSPAISPSGDRMIWLSDRTGYFDLYSSSITEPEKAHRILHGQQSGKFESLHWLRPGISWSPDENRIAIASKAGDQDALFILDPESGKVLAEYKFDLEGLFSPSWSPAGDRIAFVALQKGHSDIWILDLDSGDVEKVTEDRYSDFDPSFSPDGKRLVFVSDRNDDLSTDRFFDMSAEDYGQMDVYEAVLDENRLRRVTHSPFKERTPVYTWQDEILFVSDAGGAFNLYSVPADQQAVPLRRTNMLTGIFQPSVSRTGKLLFSSFEQGGYDIFLLKDINRLPYLDEMPDDDEALLPFNRLDQTPAVAGETREPLREDVADALIGREGEWKHFDFTTLDTFEERQKETREDKDKADEEVAPVPRQDEAGNYVPRDYRIRFSPDLAEADAYYDNLYGFQGAGEIVFSDLLGNHRLNLYLNVYDRIELSNFHLHYIYQARRTDVGGGVFRYVRYLDSEVHDRFYQDNQFGAFASASYPFNQFMRLGQTVTWTTITRDSLNRAEVDPYGYGVETFHDYLKGNFLTSTTSLVFDNSLWGSTGPANGSRAALSYTRSYAVDTRAAVGNDFHSLELDMRKYFRLSPDLGIAARASMGASYGSQRQVFFLGGAPGWINSKYYKAYSDTTENTLRSDITELYYSSFIQPLRGTAIYQGEGDRYALANLEFRFPIIHYLVTGWPFNMALFNLRGVLFTDVGTAWYQDKGYDAADSDGHLRDLMLGYGWGTRLNVGFALLKFDWAWSSTLDGNPLGPQLYLTLGADF